MTMLRLATMYLRFAPLQPWVALAALAAMACGTLVDGPLGTTIYLLGAVLLVMVPSIAGGVVMRMASGGSGMSLRPAGYRRMLGGALLATVMLAFLHTIPVLLAVRLHWIGLPRGVAHPLMTSAGAVTYLLGAWSLISLMWLGLFFAMLTPLRALAVVGLVMLAGAFGGSYLDRAVPFEAVPATVLAGWTAFAAWYLRGPKLRGMITALQMTGWRKNKRSLFDSGATGRNVALRAYLVGGTSWAANLISGAAVALSIAPMIVLTTLRSASVSFMHIAFAMIFAVMGGAIAITIMRRARFLWLKAGLDREGLFRAVEQVTAGSAALATASYTLPLITIAAIVRPGMMTATLLFSLAFVAFGVAVIYAALCFVHPWRPVHVIPALLCFAAWAGMVVALLPQNAPDPAWYWIATGASLGLAALLRALARRRWHRIDWQRLRPFLAGMRNRLIAQT